MNNMALFCQEKEHRVSVHPVAALLLGLSIAGATPWYTAVAADSAGNVCAGSIGAYGITAVESESVGDYYYFTGYSLTKSDLSQFMVCQNAQGEDFYNGDATAVLMYLGGNSFLDVEMGPYYDLMDSTAFGLYFVSVTDNSLTFPKVESDDYEGARDFLLISPDSLLVARNNGLALIHISTYSVDTLAGLPEELSSGPVRSLALDFEGQLWAGTDSGVWVRSVDSVWSFRNLGWSVRYIAAMDSHVVFLQSQKFVYDGGDPLHPDHAGCYQDTTWLSSCWSVGAYPTVPIEVVCPEAGNCFFGKGTGGIEHVVGDSVLCTASPYDLRLFFDMDLAPDGTLWMAGYGGLYSVDTATCTATRHYMGDDTLVTPLLPSQTAQGWSVYSQGLQVHVWATDGSVELLSLNGRLHSRTTVVSGAAVLNASSAGLWIVRWVPRNGTPQTRTVLVE
ncbi:MAG TPA: hypothetical protein VLM37_05465 [Fibrobacteraceae bacterium]|nr:hypothetical protein [Fibrobacteraceae bacterium]